MQALLVILLLANFSQTKPKAAAEAMNPDHPLARKPNEPNLRRRLPKNFQVNNQLNKQERSRADYFTPQINQPRIAAAKLGLSRRRGQINRGQINRRQINRGILNDENINRVQINRGHVNRRQINRQISRTNQPWLDKILERIEDRDLLLTTKMVKWLTQRFPFLKNFWKIPFPDGLKSKNMSYWFPEQVLCILLNKLDNEALLVQTLPLKLYHNA